jgi:hypothetical protein
LQCQKGGGTFLNGLWEGSVNQDHAVSQVENPLIPAQLLWVQEAGGNR